MLRSLFIENFKPLDHIELKLAPLTVLTGPNNVGKSSTLQLLAFLKQSIGRYPNYAGPYVNLGAFETAIHKRRSDLTIRAEIEFDLNDDQQNLLQELIALVKSNFSRKIRLTAIRRRNLRASEPYDLRSLVYRVEIERESARSQKILDASRRALVELTFSNQANSYLKSVKLLSRKTDVSLSNAGLIAGWNSTNTHSKSNIALARFASRIRDIIAARLERNYYLPAHRSVLGWSEPLADRMPMDVLPDGQNLGSLLLYLATNKSYKAAYSSITKWAEAFGLSELIGGIRENRISILEGVDPWLKVPTDVAAVGFGLNQLIPVIVQSFIAPSGSLIMIEEPEMHLHPVNQTKLVGLFIELLKQEKQLLVTTHSDHLVKQIRSAARKGLMGSLTSWYYMRRIKDEVKIEQLDSPEGTSGR